MTRAAETCLSECIRVLANLNALERAVSRAKARSRPPASENTTTRGFRRRHIARLLSACARTYPDVDVQRRLSDRPASLVTQGLDLAIRIGERPAARLTAINSADYHRVLCTATA